MNNNRPILTRRDFARHLAALLPIMALPNALSAAPLIPFTAPQVNPVSQLVDRLLTAFPVRKGTLAIGEAFAVQESGLSSSVKTVSVLMQNPILQHALKNSDGQAQLAGEIARAIKFDFEKGKTADVQGWILAETELQLCTLAYHANHA